jgi:hypothetical protein
MVNVKDFKAPKIVGDKLDAIFGRQRELMKKYHIIEATSGLLQTYDVPVDLDDAKGQARIKDFAWRCTEELMEAMDAHQHKIHFREEIADAFHFLVELVILSGFTAEDMAMHLYSDIQVGILSDGGVPPQEIEDKLNLLFRSSTVGGKTRSPGSTVMEFLIALGMTCHTLKNKPWVQTQRITDREEFKKRLIKTFRKFIGICIRTEIDSEELFDLYFRKSEVNKFRQRSQY